MARKLIKVQNKQGRSVRVTIGLKFVEPTGVLAYSGHRPTAETLTAFSEWKQKVQSGEMKV